MPLWVGEEVGLVEVVTDFVQVTGALNRGHGSPWRPGRRPGGQGMQVVTCAWVQQGVEDHKAIALKLRDDSAQVELAEDAFGGVRARAPAAPPETATNRPWDVGPRLPHEAITHCGHDHESATGR